MDEKLTVLMAVIAVAVILEMVLLAALCFILHRLNERLESVRYVTYLVEVIWQMGRARLLPALEETRRVLQTSRPKIEVILDNLATLTSTIHNPAVSDSTATADLNGRRSRWIEKTEILSRHGKEEAKVVREQLARRGSDNPHSYKLTAGFRTCRICGLARSHEVHDVKG